MLHWRCEARATFRRCVCVYVQTHRCVSASVCGGDCRVFVYCVWQAMPVACSPVHLLQLLRPAVYPESDAATVAAQARASVLIYLRTLTRARIDVAARRVAAPPPPPAYLPLSSLVARIGAAMLRRESWGQMSVARRVTLLALVLLAAVALLKLSRGSVLRAVGLLFRYRRQ
jgi:hypothetical protein